MKTALVTGANKGIGLEAARQLLAKGFRVFVAARHEELGRAAVKELGAPAVFLHLDVSDEKSVRTAAKEFAAQSDTLDVLVNNAGVLLDEKADLLEATSELILATLQTNTLGPLRVIQAFAPLLAKSAEPRVINVSSGGGQLDGGADGWAPVYCISKTALNGVTSQLATALPKFAINVMCPGWVRTDMGGANAARSVEQGADTITWLATESPQSVTGKFFRDRKEIPW